LKRASEIADGGPMVVAGSLYLVGSVLRALRESGSESGDRGVESDH
jgi:folylpolyglutamate synthase/dihydropteroate synthase